MNRGTSSNDYCMSVLRFLFWYSVCFNFHLRCIHIDGDVNIIPDSLSRIAHNGYHIFQHDFSLCCSPEGIG